jgi:type VI secretion system protein ImpL
VTVVFFIALVCSAVLGLLAIWLIVRARTGAAKPPAPPSAAAAGPSWLERTLDALDYLRTRREWRYGQPWVLLLGDEGSGKSSLLASLEARQLKAHEPRDAQLLASGTSWTLCNRGVLIDPQGRFPSAAVSSKPGEQWRATLDEIVALRPERALDGVVLVVSAATLLHPSQEVRTASAESAYRQLCVLQDEIEFALPVYVVISQADQIEGFSAFWSIQPPELTRQMFGWSAAALDASQAPSDWADAAFDSIGDALRILQLRTLIEHEQIDQTDPFFLFPVRVEALRAACSDWLGIAFRSSAWRAGFLCRGVWLAGSSSAQGAQASGMRTDVQFVDELIEQKVLAETHLAYPTRSAVLSRNSLIRYLQIGAVAALALLALGLAISSWRVQHQVERLTAALEVIRSAPVAAPGGQCASRQQVMPLLAAVRDLQTGSFYAAIPASWLDRRLRERSADEIATHVFDTVIMPGIACQLGARANRLMLQGDRLPKAPVSDSQSYTRFRTALFAQVRGALALENALARYRRIAGTGPANDSSDAAHDFAALAAYAYEVPVHEVVQLEGGDQAQFFASILERVHVSAAVALPDQMQSVLAGQIGRTAEALRVQLRFDVQTGETLLAQLEHNQEPVLKRARYLVWWLDWVRSSWLGNSSQLDPCLTIAADLQPETDQLSHIGQDYEPLKDLPQQFDRQQCSDPAHKALQAMQLAPYGALFTPAAGTAGQAGVLQMNPALAAEQQGLDAVLSLNFMQIEPSQGFSCVAGASAWKLPLLDQVGAYVQQYQGLSQHFGLPPLRTDSHSQPLYNRVALSQLEKVMNSTLTDAQQSDPGTAQQAPAVGNVSTLDQQLSQQSSDLQRTQAQLIAIQQMYAQLGLSASRLNYVSCLRGFASEKLGQVQSLANQSLLYDPLSAGDDNSFFNLGTTAVTVDYLSRQAARAQVLTGYAAPFTAVLLNTVGNNDAQLSNYQSAPYWSNTIAEMNHHLQFKGQNDQVSYLESMFLTQFPGVSVDNCAAQLKSYQSAASGNDMFSILRGNLERGIERRCVGGAQVSSADAWKPWLDRFNTELAGRFPFGPTSAPDVAPATVQAFFADYTAQAAKLKAWLPQLPADQAAGVKAFAAQLDAANSYFTATLGAGAVPPPVHLNLTFRADAPSSPGSAQILSWLMQSGAQTAGYPNLADALDWPAGQPLTLALTWADRSLYTPVGSARQPDLRVNGLSASFSATGNWALLRLIAAHRQRSLAPSGAGAASTLLLEFDVPVIGPITSGGPVLPLPPGMPTAASGATASTAAGAASAATASTAKGTSAKSEKANANTFSSTLHAGVTPAFLAVQLKGANPANGAPVPLSLPANFPYAAPNL